MVVRLAGLQSSKLFATVRTRSALFRIILSESFIRQEDRIVFSFSLRTVCKMVSKLLISFITKRTVLLRGFHLMVHSWLTHDWSRGGGKTGSSKSE